ncbi:MAG: hypothetical protein ACPGSE_00030 [Synechococcus sp.]
MFPRRAAFVDELTTLVAGSAITVPNLQHSDTVEFVAFFDAAASGSVAVTAGSTVITLTAPSGGGKVHASRLGIEIGEVTSVSLDTTGLTAGTAKVVLF